MNFITPTVFIRLMGINAQVFGIESDNVDVSGHRVTMDLDFFENDVWTNVLTIPIAFVGNQAYINISRFFDLDIDLPELTEFQNRVTVECSESHKLFRCIFNEYLNDIETPDNSLLFSNDAIKGGVETIRSRSFSLHNEYLVSPRFFTQQPIGKKEITREQPEFMYFFLNILESQSVNLTVTISVTFSDSTGNSYTDTGNRTFDRGFYRIGAGFQQLNLSQYEDGDKQVTGYLFRVVNSDTNVELGEMNYVVNRDTFDWEQRYFIFENNLGGLDTLRTDGKGAENIEIKRRLLRKVETPFLNASAHTHSVQNTYQSTRKVSTGWIDGDAREWLKTLFISPNVWLYLPDTNEMIPVTIGDRSAVIHQDDDSLQDISFTYNFVESQAI